MDFNAIIKRVIGISTNPNGEWDTIKGEAITVKDLYMKFAIFLYAIPSIALFFGSIFSRMPIFPALLLMIFSYIFTVGGIFLLGIIANALSPNFGGDNDAVSSHKLIVFGMVPYAVLGALFLLVFLTSAMFYLVLIGSLYCFYLIYIGAQKLKGMTQDKVVPFVAILAVIWLVLLFLIKEITGRIAMEIWLSSLRGGGFRGRF